MSLFLPIKILLFNAVAGANVNIFYVKVPSTKKFIDLIIRRIGGLRNEKEVV